VDRLALLAMIIGALNWGLIGLFRFDLLASLFGATLLSKILYSLIGIAGLYSISLLFRERKNVE